MKVCPTCSREFPDNVKFCQSDGTALRSKSASADLIGQVVAERYHIVKKLGEGGMGAVYLGEHVKMGRKSAIKVMAAAMSQDPDAISRFNREAANASRISHANVCQVYDFGETPEGLIYLAMEFIEGESLKDVIEEAGALDPARAANIIRQSADALQAAHDLGIVHRDIKPDNIMVVKGRDGGDVVKVVDFGIARAVGGDEPGQKVTKTGLVVGTPEYMSPEQLSGDPLDGRSDIYSLALVLYRMLTGDLPFKADSAQEVMIKRLTDEPMSLEEARPDLTFPPKLQLVLNSALARLPAERYQNAAEFGRDAMDAVAGMAMPQTRVGAAPQPEGATHIMSKDEVAQATRQQEAGKARPRRETAPTAAAAKKGLPLGPILGGAGGLVGIAALAVVMMMKSGGAGTRLAGADTGATRQESTAAPNARPNPPATPGGTRPPGSSKQPPIDHQSNSTTTTPNPVPTPPANPLDWGETLAVANRAFDDDQMGTARGVATRVYNSSAPAQVRASAAVLIATTHVAASRTEDALTWYDNAKRLASGDQRSRIESAIAALQTGRP